jgi:DNA-binding transcriptional LysR family regulator
MIPAVLRRRRQWPVGCRLDPRQVRSADLVSVATPGYLAVKGALATVSALASHACIVFVSHREPRPWSLKIDGKAVSHMPCGAVLTGAADHIRAAVLFDLGIAQVPRWLLDGEIRSGRVQLSIPNAQPAPVPIHIVHPSGGRLPVHDFFLGQPNMLGRTAEFGSGR